MSNPIRPRAYVPGPAQATADLADALAALVAAGYLVTTATAADTADPDALVADDMDAARAADAGDPARGRGLPRARLRRAVRRPGRHARRGSGRCRENARCLASLAGTVAVTVIAAVGSYDHMRTVALDAGQSPLLSALLPCRSTA